MYCNVCGIVDDTCDENASILHCTTPIHICNTILADYKNNKKYFSKNRDGLLVLCSAESSPFPDAYTTKVDNSDHHKIRIYVKPNQTVKFWFNIKNDLKKDSVLFVGVQMAHPQPQFKMNHHKFVFGDKPHILESKATIMGQIWVTFEASDIGQYEMPIMFTFHKVSEKRNIIFVREMVVMVEEHPIAYKRIKSPYNNVDWQKADCYLHSTTSVVTEELFKIPKPLKILLPRGLEEKALEGIKLPSASMYNLRGILMEIRSIFDEGLSKRNYIAYFQHLLWWEEIIARINLRKYNMSNVPIMMRSEGHYWLEVPGLAEKRPSLLRGDRVLVRKHDSTGAIYECIIKDIEDSWIRIDHIDESFIELHKQRDVVFDVRFLLSRVPMERTHEAVTKLFLSCQERRVFPEPNSRKWRLVDIYRFYNPLIKSNEEQQSAVCRIVSRTSGKAPYIVFGPPGTGKTMTIVEAIVQIVTSCPRNRVLVCTDSNMAADHIAVMLLKYNKKLKINNYLLRANSQSREWTVMPAVLHPVSNGTSCDTFISLSNAHVATYRIVVTTLLHAAKYCTVRNQRAYKLSMTHLFIDEAAQASEPVALVPITGLLSPKGQLVLAGDPQQLGPVCISKDARDRGLGKSLMERLKESYPNLYNNDPNYITMLVKNFRSDPDILKIPNELFYNNCLQALAPSDPLSKISILGYKGGKRAIVFHAVHSREQRMGKSPSYYNEKELEMLQRYIRALIVVHSVPPKDIAVIAPYIRQVYKMKAWLLSEKYEEIEVGTVESFQGKEKRVVLVSTVRANCRLLEYDAKYGLGFLVDDKRYNVTLTRAKSKLIIVGNPTCLTRDSKWRTYMGVCKEYDCYFGEETEQLERTSDLLTDIAIDRFNRCRLTEALKESNKKQANKK